MRDRCETDARPTMRDRCETDWGVIWGCVLWCAVGVAVAALARAKKRGKKCDFCHVFMPYVPAALLGMVKLNRR